jgi:hypothetical protein
MSSRTSFLSFFLIGLFGCSYTSVEVAQEVKCPQDKTTLIVNNIEGGTLEFYSGLYEELGEIGNIKVVDESEAPVANNELILTGQVRNNYEEVAKSSSFKDEAFWETVGRKTIGMGVGKFIVEGEFNILGSGGQRYLKFNAVENYAGGTGTGGVWDYPAMAVGTLRWGASALFMGLNTGIAIPTTPVPYPVDFVGVKTLEKRLGSEVGEVIVEWVMTQGDI